MTREEAKEILTHNWTRVDNPNYSESELDEAFFMAIEALHREEAEAKGYCHRIRPKGEWIPHATSVGLKHYAEYARCSECGEMALVHMNFCPNCGADMRGDKHETD